MRQFDIKSHEQLRAMAEPIRTEIVEIVSFLGPCSIRQLARYMGRKRPALHFHVARLMEVGLLLEAGDRGEGRQREMLYRTVGAPIYMLYDREDPLNVDMTIRYSKNILSRAQRQLASSFSSGRAVTDGPERDTHATQMTAWLTKSELARLNKTIAKLDDLLKPSDKIEGRELYSLTLGLAPVNPHGSVET